MSHGVSRRLMLFSIAVVLVVGWATSRAETKENNLIGSSEASEAALIGTLYDLKQTQDRKPLVMDAGVYDKTLAQFVLNGWDESVLNKYFRITHPFYTTQVFIPMLGDKVAPKAFGVQDRIQDSYWFVHYKGQVVPPADGRYRFVGYAHATILVAVNGQLVLNGCRFDISHEAPDFPLRSTQTAHDPQAGAPAGDHRLTFGPWIDLKHSEPIDIDILFGNRVASELCAFLLVQKEGGNYDTDNKGFPILPIFQVARYDGPPLSDKRSTKAVLNAMIWKSLQ